MSKARYGQEIPVRVEVLTHANERMTRNFFCGNQAIDEYFRMFAAEDAEKIQEVLPSRRDEAHFR